MTHLCTFLRGGSGKWDKERVWMIGEDGVRTEETFWSRVESLGIVLERALQLDVGSRVCLLGETTIEFLEVLLGCLCNGWIVVLLNYRWSETEAIVAVEHVAAHHLFFSTETASLAMSIMKRTGLKGVCIGKRGVTAGASDSTEDWIGDITKAGIRSQLRTKKAEKDAAVICFSSGTTGKPKGVLLSHEALCFQLMYKMAICGYCYEDVYLHTAPLFHVGGLVSSLTMVAVGARQIFVKRFIADTAAALIHRHSVTAMIAVPSMMTDLATQKSASKNFSTVRKLLIGGGALNRRQALSVGMYFPNAYVWTAYGMTEACSSLTYNGPIASAMLQRHSLSAGYAIPGTSVSIDDATGEVLAKGPHLTCGYFNDAESTEDAFDRHGWFRTGDVGYIDAHGALVLRGRLKEMIKSGGENIYPSEIEAILVQHPAIRDVAVVGIPDERLGEALCANVVLELHQKWIPSCSKDITSFFIGENSIDAKHSFSPEDLHEHCILSGLTRFKLPRIFVAQTNPLPRTSTGKLHKASIHAAMCHIVLGKVLMKGAGFFRSKL